MSIDTQTDYPQIDNQTLEGIRTGLHPVCGNEGETLVIRVSNEDGEVYVRIERGEDPRLFI